MPFQTVGTEGQSKSCKTAKSAKTERTIINTVRISWKDKVKNESVRRMNNQSLLECTLQKRRLRWFGPVQRMENVSRARQALHWIPAKKRGRPRITWRERDSNGHQPDECDVGWNRPNSNGQTGEDSTDRPM